PGVTPSTLTVPAFNPAANPSGTLFTFPNGTTTINNSGAIQLNAPNPPGGTITMTNASVLTGTTAGQVVTSVTSTPTQVVGNVTSTPTQVVGNVTSTPTQVVGNVAVGPTNTVLTSATTINTTSNNALTSVTSAPFVNGLTFTTAPILTDVTPIRVP